MYITIVKRFFLLNTLLLLLLIATACSLFNEIETDPTTSATITSEIPTPINTPLPQPADSEGANQPAPIAEIPRLTVWTIPSISPRSEVPGGTLLATQLALFDENHPNFELFIELKAATGQGGIMSYLLASRGVAPTILPDLALIPAEQIPEAVANELIYPLTPLLSEEMINDLYPVSSALGSVDGQLYGYPYALNGIQHLVYDSTALETVPEVWEDLADTAALFVFPADSTTGGRLLLQFYMDEGGSLVDGSNQPSLELEPLIAAYTTFNTAQQAGRILTQSNALVTLDDSWLVFQNSDANATMTTAAQYLQLRSQGLTDNFAVAPLPGPNGPLTSQLSGWAWVITTNDPARQALAAELLTWLVNGPNLGDWSWQVQRLPSRRSAFERWPNDPYISFLQSELERATVYPQIANGTIMDAFTEAMFTLTSPAGIAPEVLAEMTIQAIKQ